MKYKEKEYEVAEILRQRSLPPSPGIQYKVRWRVIGETQWETTWVPQELMADCPKALEAFGNKSKKRGEKRKRSKSGDKDHPPKKKKKKKKPKTGPVSRVKYNKKKRETKELRKDLDATKQKLNKVLKLITDDMECVICKDLCLDPVQSFKCAHSFCRMCVAKFFAAKTESDNYCDAKCPKCSARRMRKSISRYDLKKLTDHVAHIDPEFRESRTRKVKEDEDIKSAALVLSGIGVHMGEFGHLLGMVPERIRNNARYRSRSPRRRSLSYTRNHSFTSSRSPSRTPDLSPSRIY